jgi:U32 family peptidase
VRGLLGQCLTSESLGGRSANRGQCAQACRLPYELICDGRTSIWAMSSICSARKTWRRTLCLPELIDAGVTALKIEGRLKTPEYVANITRHYREAIDAPWPIGRCPLRGATSRRWSCRSRAASRRLAARLRSQDAGAGPEFRQARRVARRGDSHLGQPRADRLERAVKPGDGIVFEGDRASGQEQGGRVYQCFQATASTTVVVELAFGHDRHRPAAVVRGAEDLEDGRPGVDAGCGGVFRVATRNGEFPCRCTSRRAWASRCAQPPSGATGWCVRLGQRWTAAEATKHPLTVETLEKQFGRLGGTANLERLTAEIEGEPMVPLSVLGQLRHRMVEQLKAAARARRSIAPVGSSKPAAAGAARSRRRTAEPEPPRLRVLCRSLSQLDTVLEHGAVMLDFAGHPRISRGGQTAQRATGASIYLGDAAHPETG